MAEKTFRGEMDVTETVYTWSRDKVSSCNCSEKSYRHVHCPCLHCQGKATSRSTELRHWSESRLLSEGALSSTNFEVGSHSGGGSDDELTIMDFDADGSFSEEQPAADIMVEQASVSDSEDMDVFEEPVSKEDNVNSLRQIIVKAVLDAMNIMESSGASVKTFEDILDYGKAMLFTSVGDDIDVDILSSLRPKNWSAARLLLKEEGFSDAKEYYICICRESKEMTRKGKTTTKYQYSRSWSVMESKSDLCAHCGKHGYIKYYYLGLNDKVKN